MQYLLSMDGGGTKTKWLLTDIQGHKLDVLTAPGCSHPQKGVKQVCLFIQSWIDKILGKYNIPRQNLIGLCLGIPCYGEDTAADKFIQHELSSCLKGMNYSLHNDVELGFWGAFPDGTGIHIVAGTGAIAYGQNLTYDSTFETARSNGWHYLLSDEGSGYWLGRQALSLYLKEDDGRLAKHALHLVFAEELGIRNALELTKYYDINLAGKRRETAALQELLSKAAQLGDASAIRAYTDAAHELALSAYAVKKRLFANSDKVPVSYSGGIFNNGSLILSSLRSELETYNLHLCNPCLSPECGGIWLAAKNCRLESLELLAQLKNISA